MGKSKGAKQSALKQLRSALSKAGITGPTTSSKVRKQKKSKAPNDRGHKLQAIQAAFNPFEMKIDKTKFDVLGLKRKTQVNIAVARQRALEKRKNTLGQELTKRNRVGGISDRRIGENDPTMNPEEKMIRRFALERQRRSTTKGSSVFNLEDTSDVEGEITSLTHFGRSIDEINEFGENNEEEALEMDNAVTAEHFGGTGLAEEDGEPARKKTKAEVMMEVIAKSKQHKYERQMAKEEDDGIRRELDNDFESVRALLFASGGDEKPMQKAVAEDIKDSAKVDKSYDAHVREMVFEQRARPQNRLKTEEEAAREEMERLERAERHRQRRMDGVPSDTEPESDGEEDELAAYKAKQKRLPVADDLGDDFARAGSDDGEEGSGVDLGGGLEAAQSESEEGDKSSDEDDSDSDSGAKDEASARAAPAKRTTTTTSNASKKDTELPFTFEAPSDYDAWVELAGEYSLEQQLVVIRRLRALYHIRLAPQNKQKLGDLAIILVDYVAVLAQQDPPVPSPVVDEIVKHIGELAPIDADRFGEHCRMQVIEIHQRIINSIKTSSREEALSASDIALMRVFVAVFSASDRYHSVVTPMLIAIGQYLSQFTFATPASIAGALVLVGIVHEAQRLSRRLVPEALNFMYAALAASVCRADDDSDWTGQYPLSRRQRQAYSSLLSIGISDKCKKKAVEPMRWLWLLTNNSSFSADEKYTVLNACLHLSRRFIDAYFSLPAFVELFTPLKELLAKVSDRLPSHFKLHQAPNTVLKTLTDLQEYLGEQLDQAIALRHPLKLQYHKPLAIDSVAPKFESSYSLDVHYDPDRERNESIKLRRQVNRERRGVIRELRRDAQFVAGQRLTQQREKDAAYAEKMKKAWGVLEDEQSQMKKMDRQRIKEGKSKL
ncbi:nucleolar complex protein 14 [Coemansia sp. RSA 1813]|nr:nucleolar complex protein 14 [Coemansia sp. RSA 1646]KAJ1768427.1 nucleolar complex protein 14 [Coemansia sp. RSA 1843]KAJ2090141.1 nucleolar complex protein 14 [Coemansia sp. RSA 986]KAJ2214218.1 nucleolar complex protein 14 [Coemansia sp. RSA 487]KAJ2565659.1 nucleolar complex protein 14 [Coemansia sp. RSA 1813]